MKKWTSNAEWPAGTFSSLGSSITTDEHESEEGAKAVCRMLVRFGAGGERKKYPIRTWVEEISL